MKAVLRKGLLLIVFLLILQLFMGVTTVLANPGYHLVRAGETLYSIGRLYGVDPYAIATANGLSNPDYIYIGQLLYIPEDAGPPPPLPSEYYSPSYSYTPDYWWYYWYWYQYPQYYYSYWWYNWGWWDP